MLGEECVRPKEILPEIPPELPGKKKYIPPYTPKSALENARNNPGPARFVKGQKEFEKYTIQKLFSLF